MAKENMLSADRVMKLCGNTFGKARLVRWKNTDIYVRRDLEMADAMRLPQEIVDMCVMPDGSLAPEFFDFAVRARLLVAYANVELPENAEDMYKILYGSDLYDLVMSVVNKAQADAIVKAARMYCGGEKENDE